MFCKNCGKLIEDGAKACAYCGGLVAAGGQSERITLNCRKCGAHMDYDEAKKRLTCPYCGYEEIIKDDEKTKEKSEKMKSPTDVDVDKLIRKSDAESEARKKEREDAAKERLANEAKSIAMNIGGALLARLAIIAVGSIISLIGAGLLIFAANSLIGNKTDMAVYLGIAGIVVLIIGISVIRRKR